MAEIASYVKPRRLYRYRAAHTIDRELMAIEQRYLYCAPYKAMNDPMEGFYSASKRLEKSERYKRVTREILQNKTQIGICSFSEVYNHELMWAHYATQFSGLCIEYDLYELLKHLPDNATFVRMFYSEVVPSVGLTARPLDEIAKMILSYKNHRWQYEREWRLLSSQGKISYDGIRCVTKVYIGYRIDPSQRRNVEVRLKEMKIPISGMALDGYSMSFKLAKRKRSHKTDKT